MGAFSIWHWLVVLMIVILVFGTKRLGSLGSDLGAALRGFRDSLRSADEDSAQPALDASIRSAETPVRERPPKRT